MGSIRRTASRSTSGSANVVAEGAGYHAVRIHGYAYGAQGLSAGMTNDPDLLERGYKIIRFGSTPVILVRIGESDFRAFTATCTHLDCIVEYQPKQKRIFCNCHNGEYDLNGINVGGPPPRPLAPYQVNVASDRPGQPGTIVVSKS